MLDKKYDEKELDRILSEDIEKLTPNELKLRLKALEERISLQPAKAHFEKRDLSGIGPEDLVTINMCANPQGDIFCIGNEKFPPGQHRVKKRVAEYLQYMVSESYKVERERLISRSNQAQSAILRGEDIARIERFENIMRED